MRVYVVIAEDNVEGLGLIREIYGVYLIESFAYNAAVEAQAEHDYAFVESHFVE